MWRSRWAAIGAAVAVSIGGAGFLTGSLAAPETGPGSTGSFKSIAPVRVLDTRPAPENVGGIAGPVGPDGIITLQLGGVAPVPANASAVVLNVTVTATTGDSFLTVWPADKPRPTASNLNWKPGVVVPNLVTVQLGADGKVSFYNLTGTTHIIADVAGYYVPSNDKFISLPITGLQDHVLHSGGAGQALQLVHERGAHPLTAYSIEHDHALDLPGVALGPQCGVADGSAAIGDSENCG